jgi:hypothetical protein
LAAGSTGAGLVSLPFLVLGPFVVFVFLLAAAVWIVGLVLMGMPVWLILVRFGVRSRWASMILGATLSGGVPIAVAGGEVGLPFAVAISLAGATAAFVGWGVAYRKDLPRPEDEIDEVFG